MTSKILNLGLVVLSTCFFGEAFATTIDWSGVYRFEGYMINNSELGDEDYNKDFGLHHLVLGARIDAGDGLVIRSRFDIFNHSSYSNSQAGAVWGDGVGTGSGTNSMNSNVISQQQKAEMISVNHLYFTLKQEHGSLLLGRAPLHFGLGLNYNAGNGMFDHWMDTSDVVGYKFMMGNIYLLPMYAKVSEGNLSYTRDDVTDMIIQLMYHNPDKNLEFGAYYSQRNSTENAGNDAPSVGTPLYGGTGATSVGVFKANTIGVYSLKDTSDYRFGIEAAMLEGESGFRASNGQDVGIKGTGIAGEFEWRFTDSKMKAGMNFGLASGDDPDTAEYEGFMFDRNYDVAFLMFNYQLGQDNFFRTSEVGGGGSAQNSDIDVETVSNVTYLSPYVDYQWKEKWSLRAAVTTGYLNVNPISGKDVDKSIGFEFDFSVKYKPNNRVTWVTELGVLAPGAAFKADGTYEANTSYGISSKAAISF